MSSLATLPASSVLAFLHDTRIFWTASAFLFRFTLTIVAILSIGIPLSFGTLLSLSYSGEHNFITCVLQLLLVLCLKYNKMAVNRSIHCVFRYASSPYILGSAPFTNVSEHFYLIIVRIFSVRFQCQLTFLWMIRVSLMFYLNCAFFLLQATFKRYYSVQKCSNKARFDILRNHQITSSASTLLLSRTKSTSVKENM